MGKNRKIPLIAVVGPTASGKTKLAVDLCLAYGGEVVSADSMQIYRGMDIGTAKPTMAERRGVAHHLIDFLSQDQSFSVAQYVQMAKEVIRDIDARGKLPVLAGGTGLYVDSLIKNIAFEETQGDPELRQALLREASEKGNAFLLERLRTIDPELASRLHPNNLLRVVRAIEVYETTGERMSDLQRRAAGHESEYQVCKIGICFQERAALYQRINARVEQMLRDGLIDEARLLYRQGNLSTALQAIGYKELFAYFRGEQTLEDAVEVLKRQTRRYAKRQLTWFRRSKDVHWLERSPDDSDDLILSRAKEIVTRSGILNQKEAT